MAVQLRDSWEKRMRARLIGLLVYAGWSGAKELVGAENGLGFHIVVTPDGRTEMRWLEENAGETVERWLAQGRHVALLTPSSIKLRAGKPDFKGARVLCAAAF